MYIFPDMIDMSFSDKEKIEWPSKAHKVVAENVLLCNSLITDRDTLINCGRIIRKIPKSKIKIVTLLDLVKLGIPIRLN
jgi:hypothetical protein